MGSFMVACAVLAVTVCVTEQTSDFTKKVGFRLTLHYEATNQTNAEACWALCVPDAKCQGITFQTVSNMCFLFGPGEHEYKDAGWISYLKGKEVDYEDAKGKKLVNQYKHILDVKTALGCRQKCLNDIPKCGGAAVYTPRGGCFLFKHNDFTIGRDPEAYSFIMKPICPDGWVGTVGNCYKAIPGSNYTWSDAQRQCSSLESASGLPWFANENEHNEFVEYIDNTDPGNRWMVPLGVTDVDSEGDWKIVTASGEKCPAPYIIWSPTSPNNYQDKEHCVGFVHQAPFKKGWRTKNHWNDFICNSTIYNGVCQIKLENKECTFSKKFFT